jgi:hypothetical protein
MAHPGFIVEFNNPSAYGRRFGRELSGLGLSARRLPHKTAWLLNYRGDFETFSEFREAVAASLRAQGSALVVSMRTRKAWVMRKSRSHKVTLIPV